MYANDHKALSARMKKYLLPEAEVSALLRDALVGRLATNGVDGFPYIVPVHFIWHDGMVCVHSAGHGMKLENMRRDPRVCFEIDVMDALKMAATPCKVGTRYQSVVLFGNAGEITATDDKRAILTAFVAKYTPGLDSALMPDAAIAKTAIMAIRVTSYTGKYCD